MTADTLCSSLQHLLRDVMCAKIGICAKEIELVQLSTGRPALDKEVNVAIDDRFKLRIPISNHYLTWEVMFNCSLPNCPPDFELNDLDFFYSVTLDSMEEMIPSLRQWDHRKNKALINVISELRSAYLKYQVEKLKTLDQCAYQQSSAYQYITLISDGRLSPDQIEVLINGTTAHFLIKLNVNLPPILQEDDNMIVLAVRWGERSCSSALVTSPNINELITDLDVLRAIKYDETLYDFVEEVSKSIENRIVTVVTKRKNKRKEFIFEMLKCMGHSVISYDALEYNNCSFLLERDGFVCVLEISFPPSFPSKPPQYRLLSAYSVCNNGQPLSQIIQNLPYSERWSISMMVGQINGAIKNKKIQLFKDFCRSSKFVSEYM